jgi:lipoate---protein ligase
MNGPIRRAPSIPDVVLTTGVEEQAWNEAQLRHPVAAPLVRLWSYREPAVVLGCSQARMVTPQEIERRARVGAAVRQAGGGAVLAGPWMLSASIVLPDGHALASDQLVRSYRWIGELYAGVLQGLGIDAHAICPERTRALQARITPDVDWACFAGFSPWEVVVGEKKIVGLAQARRRTGTLFVAGLLLDRPDWALLCRALAQDPGKDAALAACTTSCTAQLGRALSVADVAAPLAAVLGAALDLA